MDTRVAREPVNAEFEKFRGNGIKRRGFVNSRACKEFLLPLLLPPPGGQGVVNRGCEVAFANCKELGQLRMFFLSRHSRVLQHSRIIVNTFAVAFILP